jgi:hypothetical protein
MPSEMATVAADHGRPRLALGGNPRVGGSRSRSKRLVRGDDLLYRFFQELLTTRADLAAEISQLLITTMGVWFPIEAYRRWPILLPWVVRDLSCRGNKRRGIPDEWGSPDRSGYLRDDNTLIKGLTRSLDIQGPKGSHVHGSRMGNEFVASHIWRVVQDDRLASQIPVLNSFVPNLIWLPSQVAKLTDREGGVVQRTAQAMAFKIYRDVPVEGRLRDVLDHAWGMIPQPDIAIEPFALEDLNWFVMTDSFFKTREARVISVVDALEALEQGKTITAKVITTRYSNGLPDIGAGARSELKRYLRDFLE